MLVALDKFVITLCKKSGWILSNLASVENQKETFHECILQELQTSIELLNIH